MKFEINQSLHGYSEGHRLLASSFEIQGDEKRVVQFLSDLSGPSTVEGFQTYLTGYPLVGLSKFALARTWYADDLPRPGCAWTHTIYIDFELLSIIPNLKQFAEGFVHPSAVNGYDFYHAPRLIQSSDDISDDGVSDGGLFVKELERAFYYGMNPIVIISTTAAECEKSLLNIWEHQWPALRERFTFCSGSIMSRSIQKRIFDVQVIPQSSRRSVMRDMPAGMTVIQKFNNEVSGSSSNKTDSESDISLDIDQFFKIYSRDFPPIRQLATSLNVFRELLYSSPNNVESVGRIATSLADMFPASDLAMALKRDCFGKGSLEYGPSFSEIVKLEVLLTTEATSAFEILADEIPTRAANLWRFDRPGASRLLNLIQHGEANHLGSLFLDGLSGAISKEDIHDLARKNVGLLIALIATNPQIACDEYFWTSEITFQYDILNVLITKLQGDDPLWAELIYSMINARHGSSAMRLFSYLEKFAVRGVLGWLRQNLLDALPWEWNNALVVHQRELCDWIGEGRISGSDLLILLSFIDPYREEFHEFVPSLPWTELLTQLKHRDDQAGQLTALAFVLNIGFLYDIPAARDLVSIAFQPIHEAAAQRIIPERAWGLLEISLVKLPFLLEWDRCEKLRRTLVTKVIERGWEPAFIPMVIHDLALLQQIYDYCRKKHPGFAVLLKARISEDGNALEQI